MKKKWALAAQFIGIGWFVGVCIVAGFFGGRWLGGRIGSEVFFALLGVVVGIVIAGLGIYRIFLPIKEQSKDENEGRE